MTSTANETPPRIFFGHHKAATSWVIKILSDLAHLNGFRIETINTAGELNQAILDRLASGETQFLAFRNADPAYLPALGSFVGFHIIRDPRDILVSSYFSHRNSHPTENWPELAEHSARLQRLDQTSGLVADMEFCTELTTNGFSVRPLTCMRDWDYERKDIHELKYEEVILDPYGSFLDIFQFLQLLSDDEIGVHTLSSHILRILRGRAIRNKSGPPPLLPTWNILASVYDNRFARKTAGRRPGDEDPMSHYRKGVSGDWENYFTPELTARFNHLFGDILSRLSYPRGRGPEVPQV
ncbi:MAG: sulfotransferase domain-containing protein [Thiohalocapsa sp.]